MFSRATLAALLAVLGAAPCAAKPRLKPLLERLETARGEEQLRVIAELGRSGSPEAVPPLLALFDPRSAPPPLTSALVAALGELKDPRAVDPLVGAWDYLNSLRLQLRDDFPGHLQVLRASIVEALGRVADPRALPILHDALQDGDRLVVSKAAFALGAMRDRESVDALIQLSRRGGDVAQSAVESLAEIGDPRAVEELERLLPSDDPAARAEAAFALVKLKDKAKNGERLLADMVTSRRLELKDRLLAAHYLARLGSRTGLDFLTGLLKGKDDDSARVLAAQALGVPEAVDAVPALAETALASKDAELRLVIARSLGRIGGRKAESALRRLEGDRDEAVRASAKQGLLDLGAEL